MTPHDAYGTFYDLPDCTECEDYGRVCPTCEAMLREIDHEAEERGVRHE